MDPERIAELIKKTEKNTLSPEETEEINDNFKKEAKEWPERKRQLNEILYDYTEGQGLEIKKYY